MNSKMEKEEMVSALTGGLDYLDELQKRVQAGEKIDSEEIAFHIMATSQIATELTLDYGMTVEEVSAIIDSHKLGGEEVE